MSEQQIQKHKLVQFTYYITDETGSVLEQIDIPVSYVHGAHSGIHEKIERALVGCQEGDSVSVRLTPEEGFGPHRAELTYTDEIENVPLQFRRLGAEVEMQNDRGQVKTFIVSKIENGKLTVDGNHPLAGKHLVFNINVKTIRDATTEEIKAGRATGETLLH
jgi:FKBP-type peptidyl-prolyl cis-trans isomerase SlyD